MMVRRCGRALTAFVLCAAALSGCRTWSAREERAAAAYNRGNFYREAGRYEDAADSYREALSEAPGFRAASFNLALVLTETGNAEESLDILKELRSQDPRNLMIINALAWSAWKSEDPELSLAYYDEALGVFPADMSALSGKAGVLEDEGRYTEAVAVRLIIVELEPEASNLLHLADSHMKAGDADLALEVYQDVLAGNPMDLEALEGAVNSSNALGEYREELEFRRRILSVSNGEDAANLYAVARLLLVEFGSYEEGLSTLRSAFESGFEDEEREAELLGAAPPAVRPAIRNLLTEYRD